MVEREIPVDIDVRVARSKLKGLLRDTERAKKKTAFSGRRATRGLVRAFAFTGAASTIGRFNNDAPVGAVDPFDEATVAWKAAAQQVVDEQLGYSAAALRSAREQTKAAFAYQVGKTGELAGATEFYNIAKRIQTDVEAGRNLIRSDPRFVGPDLEEVSKAAIAGTVGLFVKNLKNLSSFGVIKDAFDYVVEGITAE